MTFRRKARLTITLPPRLLEDLDRTIDGQTIRNRSHAVEVALRQALEPSVSGAVVLAGGAGGAAPALQPIAGRPLIARTVSHLVEHGVRRLLVLAGEHQREIERLLGDGESLGISIRYLVEKRPRGTAGALELAAAHLEGGPFLIIHGDVLTDIDIGKFIDFHRGEGALATIAVKPRQAEREYGRVMLQGNRITEFLESSGEQGISIVNTGVYIFEREVLERIVADQAVMLETDVFPRLARAGELSAYFFQGIWYDIASREHYQRAEERWRERGESAR